MDIQKILNLLHKNFDSSPIHWLEASEISLKGNELHLSFLHPFIYDWFKNKVHDNIKSLLKTHYPEIKLVINKFSKVVFASCDAPCPQTSRVEGEKSSEILQSKEINIEKDYLADFIYNEKNALAVKAAHTLTQKNFSKDFPHLIVFYGPTGCGKSHLLKAIYQKHKYNNSLKTAFFSADKLMSSFAASWNIQDLSANSSSILIIDDLQLLENTPIALSLMTSLCDIALKTQSASGLKDSGQLWLISSLGTEDLNSLTLAERLRSRLDQGLYFELHAADLDIRLRFVERLNREKNLGLNRAQLINIARQSRKLTDAIGLMHKVEFFMTLQGQTPSMRDLDKILAADSTEPPLDWQKILEKVARRLNLKIEDILSPKRKPDFVLGRQIAMYLARNKLALSFQEIGKFFGGKDHSTVMHSIKKIQQLREYDEDMHKLLKELEK